MRLRGAVRLAVRMVVFRRGSAWLLLGTALFSTVLVGSLLQVQRCAGSAYDQGLLHARGSADDVVIQATEAIGETLDRRGGLVPASTDDAYASAAARGIDAVVLTTSDPSQVGLTATRGRLPEGAGDIAVSPFLASSLDLHPGSQVSISGAAGTEVLRVAGIVTNPGSAGDATVYRRSRAAHQAADYWVADPRALAQLEQDPRTRAYVDSGALSVASNAFAISEGHTSKPPRLVLVDHAVWVACAIAVLVLLSVLQSLTRPARQDVGALVASGFTERGAWTFVASCATGLVGAGSALGGLTSTVVVRELHARLGSWFDQSWAVPDVPLGSVAAAMSLSTCVVPMFAASRWVAAEVADSPAGPIRPTRVSRWARPVVAGALGLVLAYLYVRADPRTGTAVVLGTMGAALLAHGLTPLFSRVTRSALPPASGRVVTEVVRRRGLPLMLGCALAALASGYVVATVAPAGPADEVPGLQPAGSLLFLDVPDAQVPRIVAAYRGFGGEEPRAYGMPVSRLGAIVASSSAENDAALPGASSAVAFDATVPPDVVLTSAGLSGAPVTVSARSDAGPSRQVSARGTEDARLGGNLPGVVVSRHSALARELEMRPSGFSLLALFGFDALSETHQAKIRSLVARAAPAAWVSHADDDDPVAQDRATGLLVSIVGASVALVVALVGLAAATVGLRGVRRSFGDLGHSRALRRRMTIATAVSELTAVVLVVAFLLCSTPYPLTAALADRTVIIWFLPVASQGALILVSGWWFYRKGSS